MTTSESSPRCWAAPNTIWLGRGIAGDDTHGHVDDLARFVDARTIVLCREPNGADANHAALEENRERLERARLEDGSRPELVFLPMPAPLVFDGQRLPASLRQLLRRQRRRAGADLQRPERPGGAGASWPSSSATGR